MADMVGKDPLEEGQGASLSLDWLGLIKGTTTAVANQRNTFWFKTSDFDRSRGLLKQASNQSQINVICVVLSSKEVVVNACQMTVPNSAGHSASQRCDKVERLSFEARMIQARTRMHCMVWRRSVNRYFVAYISRGTKSLLRSDFGLRAYQHC